ncbi:MAG TPA: thiolase domain-containing protein [Mycobacterium sp.]|nr:thiolase domain-containing protein [Mycobacterium sp.]
MSSRDVAVVGFAHAPHVRRTDGTTNGVEMLMPCFAQLYAELGITKADIGFWCSGSSDYLAGRAFSFISAIDSIGAVPPINESHVEMDGAWALYEAYIKVLTGEVDTALAYGFGKSSAGVLRQILALQTDPYTVAPLWPDSISIAGLQARLGLESGAFTAEQMAQVALQSFGNAERVDSVEAAASVDELLERPMFADPLRRHDIAPITDGAAAIVLAAGDKARELRENPAWITGFEHRIESPVLGSRDLTQSPSTAVSARAAADDSTAAGVKSIEVAEIHAPFTHQQLILTEAMGLPATTKVNPSGGALAANPMFVAGMERIGFAARHIWDGNAQRVLAHATSGPALQQNLVAVLEGREGRGA